MFKAIPQSASRSHLAPLTILLVFGVLCAALLFTPVLASISSATNTSSPTQSLDANGNPAAKTTASTLPKDFAIDRYTSAIRMFGTGAWTGSLFSLMSPPVPAGTTYTWNQTGTAPWTTATNWTPTRTTPAATDVLVFNNGATTTVTGVPTQTIGQLSVSGNTTVNLQAGAAVVLTISGGGPGLLVASGSALNSNAANAISINVATTTTGSISGSMTFSSPSGSITHNLTATDANGITFNSGAVFTQGTNNTGNVFGSGTANSVVFASGSTFIQKAGSNPFQKAQPASVVVFQTGSLFSQQMSGAPSFSGRTYANFELNSSGSSVTVNGGAAVVMDNLTITAGTLNWGMTATPGHAIKGNISIASGATLNFNPLTAGTVNLNGGSNQTISGAGTFTTTGTNGTNQTFNINNPNGISLQKDITISGGLTLTSGNISTGANTLTVASTGTVSRTSGHIIGNLLKAYGATGSKTFEVGTANGYSPVTINVTAGVPANVTVKATQGAQPNIADSSKALQRYWTLTATGLTADLTFNYLASDVPGTANENNFQIFKYNGAFTQPGGTVNSATHTASISGVSSFSDWTCAEPAVANASPVPNCPTPLNTTQGTATSEPVSATDPDGRVTSASIISTPVAGITLDSFVAAPSNNTAATAILNVTASTVAGTYNVTIQYSNNDSPTPQTANCTVVVNVAAPNQQISPNCPTPLSTTHGTATSEPVSATDPDGRVTSASITSPPVTGITLNSFVAAPSNNIAATATLNVAATTAAGTYTVTIRYSNNDSPTPQTASCTVVVNVANSPISPNCPTPLTTTQGTATSEGVSATDPDGTVTSASITSTPVAGITLDNFVPAASNNTAATATLNVAAATVAGTYTVTIQYSNNDTPTPQTATCTVVVTVQPPPPPANTVVISQVYGGGGNTGSTLKYDYIELINHSSAPVNLNGWSVQAFVDNPTLGLLGWFSTPLPNFTLQPGQYFLIQESQGAGGTDDLPTPDAVGTIAVSSSSTKVALVNNTTLITAACPNAGAAGIVDLVGYGPTDCFEGSGTAPGLSNTTADFRLNGGCFDTNENAVDFVTGAPSPHNTSSPIHDCTGLSATGSANPSTVLQGTSTTLTVHVAPAQNPDSSGLTVTADLSLIGGSASQPFSGSGTTFTFFATVPANNPSGIKSLPVTVADGQGRTGNTNILVSVLSTTPEHVTISQVYGGGGNSGATYQNDYVELYNPTSAPITMTGWSLQYAAATGTSFAGKQVLGGTIDPGHYYLVSLASQGPVGSPLPPASVTGTDINMAGAAGKIVLVSNSDTLTGACPIGTDPDIVDFVGYGTTANCHEGTANAPAPSNTTAIFRKTGGGTDTDQNGNDFVVGPPNPRSTTPVVEFGPSVAGTDPSNNALIAPYDTSITADFSEPVDAVGTWYNVTCTNTGLHSAGTVAHSADFKTWAFTPNTTFQFGERCTATIYKDQIHDQDTDDSGPNTDTLTADYVWSFTIVGAGQAAPYPPSVHLTMGNPSNAVADLGQPLNYLMMKPTYATSYNRDKGTPNWVSWHLDPSWYGTLVRVDTFRPDPAVDPTWYRVQAFDYSGTGFDRGHMTPNADRDNQNRIPINQETYLMSNMVPQAPDNNQGPWANLEAALRTEADSGNELYIVSGPLGVGGVGSANGNTVNTIANGHVTVPAYTWKVALILPSGSGDDISRVTCSTKTIAVLMPNAQGIRSTPWQNFLTTVDAIEQATGYDLYSNLPPAVQACVEAGINGVNPPGTADQSASTQEYTPVTITLQALRSNTNTLAFSVVNGPTHGSLGSLGATSCSGGSCTATISYTPGPNYNGPDSFAFKASDGIINSNVSTVSITVTKATATINVSGYTGIYDGNAHSATGSATGVNGEDLTSLLDFGVSFTNVPGGTAHWTFAGNENYLPSSGDATITITKASSTTTVTCPASQTYAGSAIEPCTASYSGAGGLSGSLTPVYANNINAGSATATASYTGDSNHDWSTGNGGFTINKASSTTTVTCPAIQTYAGSAIEPCTASYSGAAGLSGSLTPVYTNNINAGSATATASYSGDANHDGSTGNGGFTINKASSITTVTCSASETYTGSAIEPCSATVTGVGGLNQSVPVVYSNNINAGSATATATFGGDANHEGSTGNGGFTITKASSTTTVTCPASETYTGAALTPCSVVVAGVNLSVAPAADYANNTNVGTATASYTYAGDTNHNGSSDSKNFEITKASTTTTVTCPASETYMGSALTPCTVTVTGANLSVTPGASYANNTNVGTATASYNYAGDPNHTGSSDSKNFEITKAATTTTVTCPASETYTGAALTPCSVTVSGPTLSLTPGASYTNNTNVGTATASYTYVGDANHDGSSDSKTFEITRAATITTVTCPTNVTYTGSALTPCSVTITGANLSLTASANYASNLNVGTATASYTYAGDANHTGSSDSKTFEITRAATTTTVTCPTSVAYTGSSLTPCSVTVTGPNLSLAPGASYANNTNVGTAAASYTYAGDANHTGSSDSKNFEIMKASSTTTVTCPASETYTGSPQTPCTASYSGPGGLTGSLTPSYSNNTNVGTAGVTATYDGDANHTGSSGSGSFEIGKAASTTTVNVSNATYDGNPHGGTATATGVGGLNQTLTVTYNGRNLTTYGPSTTEPTNAGDYTASATFAGDDNHTNSADARDFTIDKASSTTTVTCTAGPFVYSGSPITPCTASATGAGSLAQTLTVGYTDNVNAGNATASASFGGDGNHTGSSDSKLFAIAKANQLITFGAPNDTTFGAANFTINATSSSGLVVSLVVISGPCTLDSATSPANVHITGAGTCNITSSQAGNSNYNAATDVSRSFNIAKANQTISFGVLPNKVFGDPNFSVSATGGGSGNPITFTATGNCTVSGNTVHITGAGSCTVVAAQSGDANYNPAADVGQSFSIAKAPTTTTVSCPASLTYAGVALTPCSVTVTGASLSLTPAASYANNINVGTATASYTYAGDSNHFGSSDSKNFQITKANANITITPYNVSYDGNPHTATGTAKGVQNETLSGLNLSGTTHTNAGSYPNDPWTFTDVTGNYNNASGTVADNIAKATPLFSNLSSPIIDGNTASVTLSGKLTLGPLVPPGNVAITLNSVTQNAAIQPDGSFSSSFSTASLVPANSPYAVTFAYAGNANFNSANAGSTVTIKAPRKVKQDVLAALMVLRAAATNKKDQDELDDAIKHLNNALDPSFWVDDSHPTEKDGEKVFNEEKTVVKELAELIKNKQSMNPTDAALMDLIARLVQADRELALISISEETDPQKVAKATDEIAKGDAERDKDKPDHADNAIDHYRKAWKKT